MTAEHDIDDHHETAELRHPGLRNWSRTSFKTGYFFTNLAKGAMIGAAAGGGLLGAFNLFVGLAMGGGVMTGAGAILSAVPTMFAGGPVGIAAAVIALIAVPLVAGAALTFGPAAVGASVLTAAMSGLAIGAVAGAVIGGVMALSGMDEAADVEEEKLVVRHDQAGDLRDRRIARARSIEQQRAALEGAQEVVQLPPQTGRSGGRPAGQRIGSPT